MSSNKAVHSIQVTQGYPLSDDEKVIMKRIYTVSDDTLKSLYNKQQSLLYSENPDQNQSDELVKPNNQEQETERPFDRALQSFLPSNSHIVDVASPPINHIKDQVIKRSSKEKEPLAIRRNALTITPFNIKQLRDNFSKGLARSNLFDGRSRSDFYTISNANTTETKPLLMDAFSYCDGDSLHLDAIFNLKYMYHACGGNMTRKALNDDWYALFGNKRAKNQIMVDTHKHSVVSTFSFPHSCSAGNHTFFVYSNNTRFFYTFTTVFIPDFTKQKYYLTACTSIDKSPVNQVKAWLNHNYFHGVEHVTIYLNAKPEFWYKELGHYVQQGFLDLVEFTYPGHRKLYEQSSALNSCNRRYRFASEFVIYNDVDEFFLPMNETRRIVDVVHLYDEAYPDIAAFRVCSD